MSDTNATITDEHVAAALDVYHESAVFSARTALCRALRAWRPDVHIDDAKLERATAAFRQGREKSFELAMRLAMEAAR